jgi:hypothetical protein
VRLRDRLNALDDRAFGCRPTTEPLASRHRRLWGIVLVLLIAGAVAGAIGVPYLPGLTGPIAVGVAVAAVVTARRSRNVYVPINDGSPTHISRSMTALLARLVAAIAGAGPTRWGLSDV